VDETKILDWFRGHLFVKHGVRKELVTPTADLLADLGLDSIDQMNLMFEVEEEFGLEIFMNADHDYDEIRTIGDAIRYIMRQLNDGSSSSDNSSSS
jgi:acyl carrier protein